MSNEPFVASHSPLPPEEEDRIGALLRLHLARDEISSRAGAGSSRYQYLPTNKAVELANWIFGYDGWSSSIQDVTIDFLEESKENRWNVGVSCIMRITLRGGNYHEDVGYGQTVNMPGKAEALEKAKKEACSDGLKRAMRLFGNKLGNSLSDQQYMQLLKSGKGQKEPLDLSTSPRKRMKLEPALTASTHMEQHNNNAAPLRPHSPSVDANPASPQQQSYHPLANSPNKAVSPNAAAVPLNMSPGTSLAVALAAYNRQPAPSPPAVALSSASYPYKPRNASPAPPRPVMGKENAAAGGSMAIDTSTANAPLPSIHGIIHSLPASAHAAAAPYSPAAFTPTVKQEVPAATAPYGPPTTVSRAFPTHSTQLNHTATRTYGQPAAALTTPADVAALQPSSSTNAVHPYTSGSTGHTLSYGSNATGTAATFPLADTGGAFIAHDNSSASAPPAVAGGSFFGADDDDSGGFISQWLTHDGSRGGQSNMAAVSNNA